MRPNKLKEMLHNGGTAIGCFVQYPSPATVEILGHAGFDYVMIDCEHGPMSEESVYHMVMAAEVSGTTPLARVPENNQSTILRFLDTGLAGVMVPQVNSVEAAESAIAAIKYFPAGRRGIAPVRAANYGLDAALNQYQIAANQETLSILQFENIAALEHLEKIIQVSDIDVLFVGPNDLAQSIGYPGQLDHPEVQSTIDKVIEMTRGTDITLANVAGDAETANRHIARGFRMIGYNSIGLLATASQRLFDEIKR